MGASGEYALTDEIQLQVGRSNRICRLMVLLLLDLFLLQSLSPFPPTLSHELLKNCFFEIYRFLRGMLVVCLVLYVVVASLFSNLGLFAGIYLPLDFFNHLRLQYACGFLVAVAFALCLKMRKLAVLCVIFAVLNLLPVLWLYLEPRVQPIANAKQLKILDMNLLYSVTDYGPAIAQIKSLDPDIIVFQELSPYAVQAMKDVLKSYPYSQIVPANNPSGHGIYSRVLLSDISHPPPSVPAFSVQSAKLQISNKKVTIVNVHTLPPSMRDSTVWNSRTLEYLKQLRQSDEEMILIGDYNAAPWSQYFRMIERDLKLRDTEAGSGPQFSWPAYAPLLYVPIDHCCISSGIGLFDRRLLPGTNSDHLPLYVELGVSAN